MYFIARQFIDDRSHTQLQAPIDYQVDEFCATGDNSSPSVSVRTPRKALYGKAIQRV